LSFTPAFRRLALTLHIVASIGLLGAIAAFLSLVIAGVTGQDDGLGRGAYLALPLIAETVVAPLALASLATGIVQALGTPWGLIRHYWVLIKLLVTVFATAVLLAKLPLIVQAGHLAVEGASNADLRPIGLQLVVHAAGGLAVLLIPAVLSVYKPRGLTPYGLRRQRMEPARP